MTVRQIDPAPRRALVFTPMEQRRHLLVEAAVLAEELGYHSVVIPEGWGFDAGIVLAEIAVKTRRIGIATGVTSVWGRTSATLAMMAVTLDDISGGRFTLGLGSSTPGLAERFHDVEFDRPATRLSRTLEQVRSLLRGERVTLSSGAPGLRLGVPPRPHLPIWVGALGPRATAAAIRAADGWFPALVPLDRLDTVRESASAAAEGDPLVIAGPMVASGANGRLVAQQLVGWYLMGMGPLYAEFVDSLGYHDEIAALHRANPRPVAGAIDWPEVADPLLGQLAALGDRDAIRARLSEWDQRADIVAVCVGPGAPDAVLAAIEAGAPSHDVVRGTSMRSSL